MFVRTLSCHKAGLSVVHTFNHTQMLLDFWPFKSNVSLLVLLKFKRKRTNQNATEHSEWAVQTECAKISIKRSMLQVQDQLIVWLRSALHYAIEAWLCPVPYALNRLVKCGCFAYACVMSFLVETVYFLMKLSRYSTSLGLPTKRGTLWWTFSGQMSNTRSCPVEPTPPACTSFWNLQWSFGDYADKNSQT